MKLIDHFDTFMKDVVNLNDTRISQLDGSVEALQGVLRASDWEPKIKSFAAQGSWAHKTIIRPVDGKAFDADLLVFVKPVDGWGAKQYLTTLREVFASHGTYKDKVRRYSHCVTIEYAGEGKVDIAPCVVDRVSPGGYEVCNFNTDGFEQSEPSEYTQWLSERNSWAGKNGLRKVTRLLKFLRDIKRKFTCPSVLFTTILGERLSLKDSLNFTDFSDLPTALKTIVDRLDDWLQANPSRPTVTNPVLSGEVFSDLWDDARYGNFRDKIHTYREWIDDAYGETDRDESIGKWQRVFGDDFAKGAVVEKAARVSEEAVSLAKGAALARPGFQGDLVTLFTTFGRSVLPPGFDRLPHKKRPIWKRVSQAPFRVGVSATRHSARDRGVWIDSPLSGTPLSKGQWLRFQALTETGTPLGGDFEVQWRVANTDREASRENQLRGGFESSNDGSCRWEHLAYRGVHSVEAFVVRKRDGMLVAQSDPFYVVIE
jgi:hypothetical protein